jgi:hypothetical protein
VKKMAQLHLETVQCKEIWIWSFWEFEKGPWCLLLQQLNKISSKNLILENLQDWEDLKSLEIKL